MLRLHNISLALGLAGCPCLSPGESQWASAGAAVTYTVSVTNNDGAGCSSSTFNLASGVPAGWSASPGASSLKLAAGARGTTTLQVISPASSPDGFHDVTATARMAGASAFAGLGAATYVVNATAPGASPLAANDDIGNPLVATAASQAPATDRRRAGLLEEA